MTFKTESSYHHFISLMSLELCKGNFLYFTSGKTKVTVRKDTLRGVIHKVGLREKGDIYNLKLPLPEEISTTTQLS